MTKLLLLLPLILILSCNSNSKTEETAATTETPLVSKKIFLKQPAYKMEYYPDWKIDSTDVDFNIDHYFTLDSPSDGGFISFFIFNRSIDEKQQVEEQVKAHESQTMKGGRITNINSWGNYTGEGAIIEGKASGVFKAVIKIFAYSKDNISFLVISQTLDSEKAKDEPGLKLMESSFKLTE